MKKLLNKAVAQVMAVVPASLSPENQYAKSVAAVLCLLVSADQKFEPKEFDGACNFIANDEFLRREGLTQRTTEYFRMYCNDMQQVMVTDQIAFPSVQLDLITEVREVPNQYKTQLRTLIKTLITISEPTEVAVLNRINL